MATSNGKQRLLEVMGKVDKTFKPKLDETYGVPDPLGSNKAKQINEKIIGKKPRGKRDSVTYYKGEGAFPGYTHFAVVKADTPFEGQMLPTANKIVNGWDYRGYDTEDLKADKQWYFTQDIKDMDIKPNTVQIVATAYLKKRGIDPYTYDNWLGNELMSKFIQSQY